MQERPSSPAPAAAKQKLQPVAAESADADKSPPTWAHEVPGLQVMQVIGVGGFCKVRLGKEVATGRQVALKIVEKSQAAQVSLAHNICFSIEADTCRCIGTPHACIF